MSIIKKSIYHYMPLNGWKLNSGLLNIRKGQGKLMRQIVSNFTSNCDGVMRKVLREDNLALFSSDKIQAKSVRILSLLKGAELLSRNTFLASLAPLGVKFLSIT